MSEASERPIGKAHDYEVLAASHSEREALVGGGEHLAAATAFAVAAVMEGVRDLRCSQRLGNHTATNSTAARITVAIPSVTVVAISAQEGTKGVPHRECPRTRNSRPFSSLSDAG